jgi:hypothetical protein
MYPPITTEVNKLTQLQVQQAFASNKQSISEIAEQYELSIPIIKRIIINN